VSLSKNMLVTQEYLFHDYKHMQEHGFELDTYPAKDLWRYHAYLFYEKQIRPDFQKTIRIAIDKFLDNHLTEKDLDKLEELKAQPKKKGKK